MMRTELRICVVMAGLLWSAACTDDIGSPPNDDAEMTMRDPATTPDDAGNAGPDREPEPELDGGLVPPPVDSGVDSGTGDCPAGYVRTDGECVDIDECAVDNGECGAVGRALCANNEGAAPTCMDIDECAVNNGDCGVESDFKCVNKDRVAPQCLDLNACGTENGGCGDPAFNKCSYDTDGSVVCTDINECLQNNGGCGAPTAMACSNATNAKNTCIDVDECADSDLNDCPDDKACVNTKGSYVCGCDYPTIFDSATGTCRPARVLVLDDAGSTTMLVDLKAQGFDAVNGGLYYRWNQSPDLSGFDTILWLEGRNFGNPLLPGIDQLFVDYVKSGRGLVRTGWGLWWTADQRNKGKEINPLTAAIMPVGLLADALYELKGESWSVTAPSSPLARGLPATFTATGGYAIYESLPGSEVVATTVDDRATSPVVVLSYTTIHGGMTVHINDSLLYPETTRVIEPEIKQVYFNAVHFSAQRPGN